MEWIILIIVLVLFIFWLARGRRHKTPADPEAKTVEQSDYYVKPDEDGVKPDEDGIKPDLPNSEDKKY